MASEPLIRVDLYVTTAGESPFERWLDRMRDPVTRAKVRVQVDRLALGNFGRCRFLKGGLGELKIQWGPGYRVYFAVLNPNSVLLLCSGDKSTQRRDMDRAREFWADYRRRAHGRSPTS